MTDYVAKVAAGVELLDKKKPGWRDLINVDTLRLESCEVCILGQLFGDYEGGKSALDLGDWDAHKYGFNTSHSMSELTAAWKDALGKNNILVEKDDVYKDSYGYAVKVLQTHILPIDGKTITAYLVQSGRVERNLFKANVVKGSIHALLKSAFETSYKIKVEKFTPKKGMFVTNGAGENFYMVSDVTVRPVKDGAYIQDLDTIDTTGLHEMLTGPGDLFSEMIVK